MDTLTTPVLLVTIATNSRKARFSIGPSKCYIKKATEKLVSQSTPVGLRNESSSVSLRNQKSPVLTVNYRRRKPVFRRVSVVSGVRSLSLYLVVPNGLYFKVKNLLCPIGQYCKMKNPLCPIGQYCKMKNPLCPMVCILRWRIPPAQLVSIVRWRIPSSKWSVF
jgi:hypothetical protein